MRVLVDENMLYARDSFSRLGEVAAVPECPIPIAQLVDADALMMRSATKVNESLLAGKSTRFIDTVIAGADHVDGAWLKQAGIGFSTAPGCSVITVMEYIFSSLLMLAERDGFSLHKRAMGIAGADNAGRRLQTQLEALGIKTLLCGPPRVDRGDEGNFRSLDELVQHADTLTSHTPLSGDGPYKTLHLADEELIRSLKPGAILVDACRDAVVDNIVLLNCLSEGQKLSAMLGIREGESELSVELLKKADIGTPHITGYAPEGKAYGIMQVLEAYNKLTGHEQHVAPGTLLPVPKFGRITLHDPLGQPTLRGLVHLVYDVCRDDAPLRRVTGIPGESDKPCRNYLERREWSSLHVICDDVSTASLLCKLGFNAAHHPTH